MQLIDLSHQQYLEMIHRYLQGRLDDFTFRTRLRRQWAEQREEIWPLLWQAACGRRCLERQSIAQGESPRAQPDDPRRFPRMLDRLYTLCREGREEVAFRTSVQKLLADDYAIRFDRKREG
jgi:hypothetical protein